MHWLQKLENGEWLLIFDNADKPSLVKKFLPNNPNGYILLTSRASNFDELNIKNPIILDKMLPEEAEQFFINRINCQRDNLSTDEIDAIKKLAQEFDYLPLAMEQAGAYIAKNKCSFQDYLVTYRSQGLELLSKYGPITGNNRESIATTWSLNFGQVAKESQAAADALRVSAFLKPDNIPFEFFIDGMEELGENISTALCGVKTDRLILNEVLQTTMVAENDFSDLGEDAVRCSGILDFIDDGILALQEDTKVNPENEEPENWVDNVFRGSLAAIQSEDGRFNLTQDEFLQFIRTRVEAILRTFPDSVERKAYVASGLPLSAAKNLYRDRNEFLQKAQEIADAEQSMQAIVEFIVWLEEWARDNSTAVVENLPENEVMDLVREPWVAGRSMRNILQETDDADSICKNIYGYQIPWLVHAAAQQIKQMGYEELSDTLATAALLVELGVPNEAAAWIFLAGVRSRAASTELAQCGVDLGTSPSTVRRRLRDKDTLDELALCVSDSTRALLDLHWAESARERVDLPEFPSFTAKKLEDQDTLLVRTDGVRTYLCSPDARQRMAVKVSEKWPFDRVADDYRFSFVRSNGRFQFTIRSPKDSTDNNGM